MKMNMLLKGNVESVVVKVYYEEFSGHFPYLPCMYIHIIQFCVFMGSIRIKLIKILKLFTFYVTLLLCRNLFFEFMLKKE